jgi:hypothetical protein
LFDQESVFLDGISKLSRTEFSQSISEEDTAEFWVLGDFGLEAWNESGGVSFDGWVVSVHANENVDDVAHLVEGVEFGELFWDQKLVGISGKILVEPDGEAILAGGWGGGSVSWYPTGDGLGGWDDGRHGGGGSWSGVEGLDSVPWEVSSVDSTSWGHDGSFVVETDGDSGSAGTGIKTVFPVRDKVEVVSEVGNVFVGFAKQWNGSWDQEPDLTLARVEDSVVSVSEFVQEFLDGWTGFISSREVWVHAVDNMSGGLFVWREHLYWGFVGGLDSGVFDEVGQQSSHSEAVGGDHLLV